LRHQQRDQKGERSNAKNVPTLIARPRRVGIRSRAIPYNIAPIDSTLINSNLSSTLFILNFYRSQGSSELQLANVFDSNASLERPGYVW
jgi:hypothetical protein